MIEQPISVARVGSAEVDVMCLNDKKNHVLLWECKSGHSIAEKQARVYASATAEDVQRTGNVTFPAPSSASVDPVYCCLEETSQAVVDALRGFRVDIPVVSLGPSAILKSGRFRDAELTKRFTAGIPLPPLDEVPRLLVANTQTPKSRIAKYVFATMVGFLRRQSSRLSPAHILEETFPDWACMGTDLRRYLSDSVKEMLLELCKSELKEFARIVRATHSPKEFFVEFTADVLGQDASARTRTFQKLERHAYGYIQRIEENKPYEPGAQPESMWLPGFEPEA